MTADRPTALPGPPRAAPDVDLAAVAADGVGPDRLRAAVLRTLEPCGPSLLDPGPALARTVGAWRRGQVRVVLPGAPDWPGRLDRLDAAAPDLLAVRGALPSPAVPTVAIVGQRRASQYGREVTSWLADGMAQAGLVVVSGGAVGIDAAGHRAAVDAGGATVVVLGCGHAVPYPRAHAQPGGLFDEVVAAGGAVVSELLAHEPPRPHRFLARNRLVAALADAVVVVEGGARSGALNTATHAADLGVPVLAVPGDVRAPGSAAPNRLLAEGCAPCRGPGDVLAAIGAGLADPTGPVAGVDDAATGDDRDAAARRVLPASVVGVLAAAFPRPVTVDDLAARSGEPVGRLLAAVTRARIAGVVATDPSGVRLRRSR